MLILVHSAETASYAARYEWTSHKKGFSLCYSCHLGLNYVVSPQGSRYLFILQMHIWNPQSRRSSAGRKMEKRVEYRLLILNSSYALPITTSCWWGFILFILNVMWHKILGYKRNIYIEDVACFLLPATPQLQYWYNNNWWWVIVKVTILKKHIIWRLIFNFALWPS